MPPAIKVDNSYGGDRSISTKMGLRGVNIGAVPDFWKDLNEITTRLRPIQEPSARMQAQAIREPRVPLISTPATEGHGAGFNSGDDYEPTFGVPTTVGGSSFMQPYRPGMALGAGQAPVATGYIRRPRGGDQTRGDGR